MKVLALTLAVATLGLTTPATAQTKDVDTKLPTITVYKNPSCACCALWIEHVEEYGFETKVYEMRDAIALKDRLGVPKGVRSCHVAQVDGYLIEGHVPADLVEKLLADRPEVAGLAVPGMVVGSPGMDSHAGNARSYEVVAFTADGTTSVYAER